MVELVQFDDHTYCRLSVTAFRCIFIDNVGQNEVDFTIVKESTLLDSVLDILSDDDPVSMAFSFIGHIELEGRGVCEEQCDLGISSSGRNQY